MTAFLVDGWNWRIDIAIEKDPAGGYTLTGTLGDVPDALRIPLLDGEMA